MAKRRAQARARKQAAIAARGWRPGYAPTRDPFPQVPLVYTAGVVALRLQQLADIAYGRTLVAQHGWKHPPIPEFDRAFEACGLTRATTWRPYLVPHWRTGEVIRMRPRAVIPCPSCGVLAWRLHATGGYSWSCWRCQPQGMLRTELLLADYACGLRIGLTGGSMLQRRRFLQRRLAQHHARDLVIVAIASAMLGPNPTFPRRIGNQGSLGPFAQLGPVWRRLQPELLSTAVEQLLHPEAYRIRFGGRR